MADVADVADDEIDENVDKNNEASLDELMTAAYGKHKSEHNLRARKPRDYSHIHTTLESTVMTQYSMKKGLKVFGEPGVNAVVDELQQLHDRGALEPNNGLSRDSKRAALQYL
eukprot:scaffold348922_cov20-Attheya_sp.AAC.1